MKLEDFTLKIADGGKEYITYNEGITKTQQSGLHIANRGFTFQIVSKKGLSIFEAAIQNPTK